MVQNVSNTGAGSLPSAPAKAAWRPFLTKTTKRWVGALLVIALAGGGYYAWQRFTNPGLPAGIAGGNGRIEATEIDISTKIPGRIKEILVNEGDFVSAGQVLVRMDTEQLEAQRRQAQAQLRRAIIGVDTAKSLITQREAERAAAAATVAQQDAKFDQAEKKRARSEQLITTNAVSQQVLDDDRANSLAAKAAVSAGKLRWRQAKLRSVRPRLRSWMPKLQSTRPAQPSRPFLPTSTTAR